MGRLFWKFLLSYWAALLVAILAVGAATWLYRMTEDGQGLSLEGGPRADLMLSSAAATARLGGLPALRGLLEVWRPQLDAQVFAVDGTGRDAIGRQVPPVALETGPNDGRSARASDAVRLVRLADGETYLLFVPVRSTSLLHRVFIPHGRPPSPLLPLATGTVASLVFGTILAWYVARPIRHLRGAFASVARGEPRHAGGPTDGPSA